MQGFATSSGRATGLAPASRLPLRPSLRSAWDASYTRAVHGRSGRVAVAAVEAVPHVVDASASAEPAPDAVEQQQPRCRSPRSRRAGSGSKPRSAPKGKKGSGRAPSKHFRAASGKAPPVIKVSPGQNIGSAAAFLKRTIMGDAQALMVCSGDDAIWQTFRALRCARSMMIEDEGTTPVFQPVLLAEPKNGLAAGTMMLYTHKIVHGHFNVGAVMRVSSNSRVEFIASAVVARIKEKGSCVLESFGKMPAVVTMKAIEMARRRMLRERLDVSVAVDPVVVEVDREDIGATMMNRFVLLECAPRDPTNLRVATAMKLRGP